jgi:hypothetical protein
LLPLLDFDDFDDFFASAGVVPAVMVRPLTPSTAARYTPTSAIFVRPRTIERRVLPGLCGSIKTFSFEWCENRGSTVAANLPRS